MFPVEIKSYEFPAGQLHGEIFGEISAQIYYWPAPGAGRLDLVQGHQRTSEITWVSTPEPAGQQKPIASAGARLDPVPTSCWRRVSTLCPLNRMSGAIETGTCRKAQPDVAVGDISRSSRPRSTAEPKSAIRRYW